MIMEFIGSKFLSMHNKIWESSSNFQQKNVYTNLLKW